LFKNALSTLAHF